MKCCLRGCASFAFLLAVVLLLALAASGVFR